MPYTLSDIIRARSCTCFCGTLAGEIDPRVLLKVPDTLGEEACGYKVQEAG